MAGDLVGTTAAATPRASGAPDLHRTPSRERSWRPRTVATRAGMYAMAVVLTVFSVFPLVWMALTSIKPRSEILTAEPVFWPSAPVWSRYADVIERGFATALVNSLVVTLSTVALGLLVAVLAGYTLARFDLPFKRYLLMVVLATQMFPLVVLIIPLFIVMRRLDLLGSYTGLVISYLSFTTPLAVWILRGFFQSIPEDLEAAALVDGCTRFGAIRRVVLPLAGPGIAACSIFTFISAWNEFLMALTFIQDDNRYTLPVALTSFAGRAATDYGAIMAFSVLFTIPVVIFFLSVHRRLTGGMIAGAVKG
jgi:ABC-type glycerol-3-phosphate transport system permease component